MVGVGNGNAEGKGKSVARVHPGRPSVLVEQQTKWLFPLPYFFPSIFLLPTRSCTALGLAVLKLVAAAAALRHLFPAREGRVTRDGQEERGRGPA